LSLRIAACQFLIAVLIVIATTRNHEVAMWRHVLAFYSAWSFLVVGCGYAVLGPIVFGKRADGRLQLRSILLIAPYHFFCHIVWHLSRVLSSDPSFAAVDERLWFGRRMTPRDLERGDFPTLVGCLDLTSEFTEPVRLRQLPDYFCVPLLDGTAPSVAELHRVVTWIHQTKERGAVYVHCAQGYGRTGALLVAYLIQHEQAKSVDDALIRLRQARSQVRLNRDQRRILDQFELEFRGGAACDLAGSSGRQAD